jgi:protein TonB
MKFTTALCISIALHGMIAVGIVAYLEYAPVPENLVALDLSSVELSFAEQDDESAPVSSSIPAPAPAEPPTPRKEKPPSPDTDEPDLQVPPSAGEAHVPEPEPEHETMKTPEIPPPSEAAPEIAPKQARIDAPPKPEKTIRPQYPRSARLRGEQGDVVMEMHIDENGTVDLVEVASSSGFPELDEAAVRAVRSARFTPAKSDGKSVASTARVTLTFRLKP